MHRAIKGQQVVELQKKDGRVKTCEFTMTETQTEERLRPLPAGHMRHAVEGRQVVLAMSTT